MYQIEKINDSAFYIKAIGTFPISVTESFVQDFSEIIKDIDRDLSVIIDITDAIFLKLESIEPLVKLLQRNNKKLYRSAFVISKNPPLAEEFRYILERADSPKRKIVDSLDEAKKWIGIEDIVFQKK